MKHPSNAENRKKRHLWKIVAPTLALVALAAPAAIATPEPIGRESGQTVRERSERKLLRSPKIKRKQVTFHLYKIPRGHVLAEGGVRYYGLSQQVGGLMILFDAKQEPTSSVGFLGWYPPIFWPSPIGPEPEPPEDDPEPEPEPEDECDPDTAPDGCECPQEFLGLDCDERDDESVGTFDTEVLVVG